MKVAAPIVYMCIRCACGLESGMELTEEVLDSGDLPEEMSSVSEFQANLVGMNSLLV